MITVELHKSLQAATGPMDLNVSFRTAPGEFIVLYGPSGSGKTSLLRMIAGLLKPDNGIIRKEGIEPWFDSTAGIHTKAKDRNVGIVFQDYALFPNMSVEQNLKYAAHRQSQDMVAQLIEISGLEKLRHRKPDQLSGGQQQRVALARALVQRPEVLLLDEPLSAIDRKMRAQLQDLILELHRKFGQTTIMVSHDVGEIVKLADRVISIDHGRIVSEGKPADLFAGHAVSAKFQLTGQVLKVVQADVVYVAEVLCGNNLVKVVITDPDKTRVAPGDHVLIASKAFNPVIQKIDK